MIHAVLADTGPLYAAVDQGDERHEQAQQQVRQLVQDGRSVLIPYPILLEAYTLVSARLGTKAALAWLADVVAASLINPIPEDYNQAGKIVRRWADQRISLVDATVAALAIRHGLEVWTYDRDFEVMKVRVWS
jgi:predicted nucleic acid-binding protein